MEVEVKVLDFSVVEKLGVEVAIKEGVELGIGPRRVV